MEDLARRLSLRVQLSSDAMISYPEAVEGGFGSEVDYGSIIKTYGHTELAEQRRYSPPEVIKTERSPLQAIPKLT